MNHIRLLLVVAFGAAVFSSCRKDVLITDPSAKLSFDTDTLTFDTVFTTLGSTTLYFKVFNTANQTINISNIMLAGGDASSFRLNINGQQSNTATDVEIPAHDSIYVFASVTVDPDNNNNPFVLLDSVLFETNGNMQKVILQAWGQNAHFFYYDDSIHDLGGCDVTWTNDKPYVIIGYAAVDTGCSLTIEQGCRIYLHSNSYLIANGGTLTINGTKDEMVQFQGDRLEHYYDSLPGQWGGILILRGSPPANITYANISEGVSGIIAGSSTDTVLAHFTDANAPQVNISKCIIRDNLQYGIFSFRSNITASNTLIFNSGENDAGLFYGGTQNFLNCTLANYGSLYVSHQTPVLEFGNGVKQGSTLYIDDLNALFQNCIVYGNLENEFLPDTIDNSALPQLHYTFDHCLLRSTKSTSTSNFISILKNNDPLFINLSGGQNYDFHLQDNSPCIDAGTPDTVTEDFDMNPRPAGAGWDIGCYEHQ